MPKTLESWIAYANGLGLLCHQVTQLAPEHWRVSCRVNPCTPELARNPAWTDFGEGATAVEAFEKCFASDRFKGSWESKAAEARKVSEARGPPAPEKSLEEQLAEMGLRL